MSPTALQQRLPLPSLDEDGIRPLSGGNFDCFGGDAAVAPCANDWTLLPSRRDTREAALAAGLLPQKEKGKQQTYDLQNWAFVD